MPREIRGSAKNAKIRRHRVSTRVPESRVPTRISVPVSPARFNSILRWNRDAAQLPEEDPSSVFHLQEKLQKPSCNRYRVA